MRSRRNCGYSYCNTLYTLFLSMYMYMQNYSLQSHKSEGSWVVKIRNTSEAVLRRKGMLMFEKVNFSWGGGGGAGASPPSSSFNPPLPGLGQYKGLFLVVTLGE